MLLYGLQEREIYAFLFVWLLWGCCLACAFCSPSSGTDDHHDASAEDPGELDQTLLLPCVSLVHGKAVMVGFGACLDGIFG